MPMTPRQALEVLAVNAQQSMPIARLNDFNAACDALNALIVAEEARSQKALAVVPALADLASRGTGKDDKA